MTVRSIDGFRSRTIDRHGALDLDLLREVAAEYDVDAAKYAHLNAGQQRMNIGNRLRACVPSGVYSEIATASVVDPTTLPAAEGETSPALAHIDEDASAGLNDTSNQNLMRLYGDVIDELRSRKVIRTGNAPLGDYAEHLFAKAFGWSLANNSAASFDAMDGAGLRFQIKARRLRSNSPGERQLGVMRALPDAKFDMLAAVLFDRRFDVYRAALIPHSVAVERAVYIPHVNGWRLMLDDTVWEATGVRDVTAALAAVAAM